MAVRLPPAITSALQTGARFVSLVPWWGWGAAGVLLVLGMRAGKAAAAELGPSVPTVKGQPPGPPPVLKLGKTGPWVSFLQSKFGIAQSGTFDAATDAAVRAFQAQKGLSVDGVVGKNTWTALGVLEVITTKPKPGVVGPSGDFLGIAAGVDLSENIATREKEILTAVAAGNVDHQWTPIEWNAGGHHVRALVSRRALAITDGAAGRLIINASMPTAQKIADMIGGALLTTRMADEIWRLADVKIAPLTRPWSQDGTMANTSRMVEQSATLDSKIADDGVALVANEGKDWVLTRRWWTPPEGTGIEKPEGTCSPKGTVPPWCSRHNSANFGWYGAGTSQSPGGEQVIQSIGLAHDKSHTDYSQLLRYVRTDSVTIDGASVDLEQALADPALSSALQDEGGTLPGIKHPDFEGIA